MKRNVAIAVIIIILFILLALAGFGIWAMKNHVAFFSRRKDEDEESAPEWTWFYDKMRWIESYRNESSRKQALR